MKRRLLAVTPVSTNYNSTVELTVASSFDKAKEMIVSAEEAGAPFDDLDLPVGDEAAFWEFVEWMEKRGRKYAFSIFGCDTPRFWQIAETVRGRGFHFNS